MDTTTYIRDIAVDDGNGGTVEMELHKSPTGGYFAVEYSFIEQVAEEVWDPFTEEATKVELEIPE